LVNILLSFGPKWKLDYFQNSFSDEEDYIELSNVNGDYENEEDVSNRLVTICQYLYIFCNPRWDQGKMTRTNCESKLQGDIVGGFLVRESMGQKILSVKTNMQDISHFMLHQDPNEEEWTLDRKLYKSLPELVDFYRDNNLPGQNVTLK
jgi:hypothetical protein